ncbi:MAG: hypothetical protein PCFJNLEI_00062 [Verrucomicrobiae bacterium]|nr:hypothetical protein [Verrucomicrobiae bacterium]
MMIHLPGFDFAVEARKLKRSPVENGIRLDFAGALRVKNIPADHVLVHGRSAGGCASIPMPANEKFTSYLQTMITRQGVTLQLCQPLRQVNPSAMSGIAGKRGVRNLTVTSGPLYLYSSPNGHALMEAWADQNRERVPQLNPVVGWNSWDYYRWTVTEEAVVRNAEFIAADPVLRRHVKRIIIDDGWQYCYGEWDANPLFPHGMEWLAKRLTRTGFEPGLWFAPAVIEPHARIAQWDTDMLAKGESGHPCLAFECMRRFGFVLDPTVPKTQRWLRALFDRYASMGYRYFKLDFLKQMLKAPVFADTAVPPGQLVRRLVEAAHRGINGRAQIMGCGYDFFAGNALVNAVRTSSDIHARWDCVKENVSSIAARWWAHGRLWENDPDFALCRGPATAKDPDLNRLRPCLVFVKPNEPAPHEPWVLSTLSLDEARTLLSLVLISGGAVNLSDDLTKLNPVGLDLIRRTVAAKRGAAGIALDLFSAKYPRYWTQQPNRVLLINWDDKPRTLSMNVTGDRARDFWTGKPVTVRHGKLTAELPAHTSLLAEL